MSPSVAELFESMAWGPAPEAADEAVAWLERHQRQFGHFVGGQWQPADDGRTFEVYNPANAQVLAHAAQGTRGDVDRAVQAARKAFEGWRQTPGHTRAR